MTHRGEIILSVFSGIDLLGMAFKQEGFCVVSAGDLLFGHDIREFDATALRGHVTGVIGGPPCQDFSRARRGPVIHDGYGAAMLREFERVVCDAAPTWFLCENVASVPDVTAPGFRVQRVDVDARECGSEQRRLRHFQFGSRDGTCIHVERLAGNDQAEGEPTCTASEGRRAGRPWRRFCELQGLPPTFKLPGFTKAGRYAAIGNGVPLPMGRALARAVAARIPWHATKFGEQFCQCGCGRLVTPPQVLAEASCRKRQQRRRDRARSSHRELLQTSFA